MRHVASAQPRPFHAPSARWRVLSLAAVAATLMSAATAEALSVRSASVAFGADRNGDRVRLRGELESFPQSIEAFPSVRIDIGPFSATIDTARLRQYRNPDGTPRRLYRLHDREARRLRIPAIYRLDLDFDRGTFRLEGRNLPLHTASNPMPFRLAAGFSDQCVMLAFSERPRYAFAYDYDAQGLPISSTRRTVVDGSRHPRWSYLPEATQASCTLIDFSARPRGFSVNRAVPVRFETRVPDVAATGLQVFEVDDLLEDVGGPRCDLHDDGRDGDDVAGDRVFSCRIEFFEHEPRLVRLVARGMMQGRRLTSPKVELDVVPELLQEDAAVFLENVYRARDLWGENLARHGDSAAAREQTAAAIRALPYVWDVAYNDTTILIELSVDQGNGILAYLPISGSDGRHGPVPPGAMSEAPPEPPVQTPMTFAAFENVNAYLSQAVAVAEDDRVKNTRVLFWLPFYDALFPNQELDDLRFRFESQGCPRFDVDVYRDNQCTLETVKRFTDYGTLVLTTESTVVPGRLELFKDKIVETAPMMITNDPVSAPRLVYEVADLVVRWAVGRVGLPGVPERRSPRLVLAYSPDGAVVWGVRPEYIAELKGRFPESVVYAGWDHSGAIGTFGRVFQAKGARTYFGYIGDVSIPFISEAANGIFDRMLDGGNAAQAFAELPTTTDPRSGARLAMLGDGRPTYAGLSGVINGDFEKSTLTGWSERGDARSVTRLGPYGARQGFYMGLLSTGLGETVEGGAIAQRLCVAAGERWLRFDWNLLSEEFVNFCHQGFDDRFQVKVNGTVAYERSVDQLCGGALTPVPGLTFDVQDDVYATNWQTASVDVQGITGGNAASLDVEFLVVDQGDQSYDTVVLLDRIRFER